MRLSASLLLLALLPAGLAGQQLTHKNGEPAWEGRTLTQWVGELGSAAPLSRTEAAYAIAGMAKEAGPATPALVKALDDESNPVRVAAMVALREIGPPAEAAIPKLVELLDDRNDEVAYFARKAIKAIKPSALPPEYQ